MAVLRPRASSASPRKLALRIGLAVGVLALGTCAIGFSLAENLRRHSPGAALALAPYNSSILASHAAAMSIPNDPSLDTGRAELLARRALLRDPTNDSAAATLGMTSIMRGDEKKARSFFEYSQKMSRRNYQVQLWAIEDAVARNDIAGAIHHYDIALRTSRLAPQMLMPVLASAINNPEIRRELTRVLISQPAWGSTFVRQVASQGPDFEAAAKLLAMLRQRGYPFPPGAHASLINGLISENRFERAWAYYESIFPGAARTGSRDPHFDAISPVPSAFDWNMGQDDALYTAVQSNRSGSVFVFDIASGSKGLLLRQLQMLLPGRYRISGSSLGNFQSNNDGPYFTLKCLNDTELGRVVIAGGDQMTRFTGDFTVPKDCPVQWLELIARPIDDALGRQSGELDYALLRKVGN